MKLPGLKARNPSSLQTRVITQTKYLPPPVQSALQNEISREPVGSEMERMREERNAHVALSLIHELDLCNEIFSPQVQDPPPTLFKI